MKLKPRRHRQEQCIARPNQRLAGQSQGYHTTPTIRKTLAGWRHHTPPLQRRSARRDVTVGCATVSKPAGSPEPAEGCSIPHGQAHADPCWPNSAAFRCARRHGSDGVAEDLASVDPPCLRRGPCPQDSRSLLWKWECQFSAKWLRTGFSCRSRQRWLGLLPTNITLYGGGA